MSKKKSELSVETSATPAVKSRARSKAKAAPVEPALAEPALAGPAPAPVPPEAIRARAHAIYVLEGGSALDNWLRAERELHV